MLRKIKRESEVELGYALIRAGITSEAGTPVDTIVLIMVSMLFLIKTSASILVIPVESAMIHENSSEIMIEERFDLSSEEIGI